MWYTRVSVLKYKFFPSNQPEPVRNTPHGWYIYTCVMQGQKL